MMPPSHSPPAPKGNHIWRDLYIAAVCVAAGLLLVVALGTENSLTWTGWGVALLFVLTIVCERLSVPMPRAGSVSVSTMPHIVSALLLPPWLAMALGGTGMLVDQLAARLGARKLLFNTASCLVTLGVTALTAQALGLNDGHLGAWRRWQEVPAFLIVSAVYYVATNLLVSTVVVLSRGGSLSRMLIGNSGFSVPAEFAVCVIGGLIAVMWTVSPFWVPLILFPAVISQIAITYISSSRRKSEELRHQALHDTLTGLPNRGYLALRVNELLEAQASAAQRSFSLLLMDLDRFKEVNDTFGHSYGDELLQAVSARLQGVVREADLLARLGGDEFALLLPGAEADHAETVAGHLLRALQDPILVEGERLYVGASIGVASFPAHGTDALDLLRHADVAMYVAKRRHLGTVVYSPDLDDKAAQSSLGMFGELRRAIEQGELRLQFQPKLTCRGGRLTSVEALVRWQHPDRGLLGPDQFIALAERTGLIQQLGRWVLDAAMRQCRAWVDQGLDVSVAINLTAKDVQPTLLGEVTGTLARYGLSADHLSVEITETMLMGDVRDTEAVLSRLREWGVRVAIDDFGTGYSSLAYLKRLPVDEVKIDRSFIYDLSVDASDTAIVESVISLGHAFGLKVTAEGVEDLASLVQLAKLGCDEVQGNYLSSPMDPGLLFAWATGGTLPRALIA